MKLLRSIVNLLIVFATVVQLSADQAESDRKLFEQVKVKAEAGDVVAQHDLGYLIFNGIGTMPSATEALKWHRRAAEKGFAPSQFELGAAYETGSGVSRDLVEAVTWYKKAAELGDASAQANLGNCFADGRGVQKDEVEAEKWFRKSATQGFAKGQHNLAVFLESGVGSTKEPKEVVLWYRKAAEQGLVDAQVNIGNCYFDGRGVPKDRTEAAKWFERAALQGDPHGQLNLGNSYFKGNGVAKNFVEAYRWYSLAAAQDIAAATAHLLTLEELMTKEQVSEAQQWSRSFKLRKGNFLGTSNSPKRSTASGTGFFITDDGYLITNDHVVKDSAQVRLVTSAGIITAKVVKVDMANDLALLKAEGRFAALPVVASRAMRLGSTVATVGFPNVGLQGFAPKLARGDIAALSGAQDDARYFQISVPLQPGNSGGALVDERGNVVGVVSAKLSARAALAATGALPENVNYAVKSSFLLSFLEAVPEVSSRVGGIKDANMKERKFEDVVKSAEQAAVLVLVY